MGPLAVRSLGLGAHGILGWWCCRNVEESRARLYAALEVTSQILWCLSEEYDLGVAGSEMVGLSDGRRTLRGPSSTQTSGDYLGSLLRDSNPAPSNSEALIVPD